MQERAIPAGERLYSLDAARALAALAVVFQHWEHFYSVPRFAAATGDSPLYWLFAPLYDKGARAVMFFFCLSGFIFYWLYGRKVHERTVGPARFAVLRLSRLYPLHLATLLLCVALQWPLIAMLGHPFIYQADDVRHFILNLFLVQYWGFESGWSFNGPSWSISVEIFLYIAFFAVCRIVRPSLAQCLVLAFAGLMLARFSALANAAVPFFLGGAAFHLYRTLAVRWTPLKNLALVAVVFALWALLPPLTRPSTMPEHVAQLQSWVGGGRPGDIVGAGARLIAERRFDMLLFPSTVLALALTESVWRRIPWVWLHHLGDVSFGVYLLHFPLQLVFVFAALLLGSPADLFTRTTTLVVFMALLIMVSGASYRWFEKPTMAGLRASFERLRAGARPEREPATPIVGNRSRPQ